MMKYQLPVPSVILLLGIGLLSGCTSSDTAGSTTGSKTMVTDRVKETAHLDRLPADDGYACAIFFGSDTYGSLDDCGCPKHPEGGLVWRMGYARAFAKQSPGVPRLHVDAGYFFADRRDPDGHPYPFDEAGNGWVLRGYNQMNFDAANLTFHDLPYAEHLLEKSTYQKQKDAIPMLGRLISANVRSRRPGTVSPPPYVIREVSGKRLPGGQKLRVGFVGLTEAGDAGALSTVFEVQDPLTAAQHMIPKLRPQCDLLVVLAYLNPEHAAQLARRIAGIDLIIDANNLRRPPAPAHIGHTTIAYTRRQTRSLGEALIYLDKNGGLADIRARLVEMDDVVPPDLAAQDVVDKAQFDIQWAREKYFRQRGEKAKARKRQSLAPLPWQ